MIANTDLIESILNVNNYRAKCPTFDDFWDNYIINGYIVVNGPAKPIKAENMTSRKEEVRAVLEPKYWANGRS